MSTHATTRIVGASVPRKEGVDKLVGRACYIDDMEREGMWYGATVRSTIPRGLIRSIAFNRRIDWSEFTVVTAADIPGENHHSAHHCGSALPRRRQGESLRGTDSALRASR